MEAIPRPRPFEKPRSTLLERSGVLQLDLVLLAAGIGLIAFSIYTLGVATSEDVPGNPYYYVVRQSIYAVVGIALMCAVARIDYSRFRELRVGIYTGMIGLMVLVLGLFPAALVFVQPDLGTALVYAVITLSVLFIAGVRWTHFAALLGGAA